MPDGVRKRSIVWGCTRIRALKSGINLVQAVCGVKKTNRGEIWKNVLFTISFLINSTKKQQNNLRCEWDALEEFQISQRESMGSTRNLNEAFRYCGTVKI